MTDRERVWFYVVYEDMGYDGYSLPVALFSDCEKAKSYCKNSPHDLDWEELELDDKVVSSSSKPTEEK